MIKQTKTPDVIKHF